MLPSTTRKRKREEDQALPRSAGIGKVDNGESRRLFGRPLSGRTLSGFLSLISSLLSKLLVRPVVVLLQFDDSFGHRHIKSRRRETRRPHRDLGLLVSLVGGSP